MLDKPSQPNLQILRRETTPLIMFVVIFLACVLLFGGHGTGSEAGAKINCAIGKSKDGNLESCDNVKCSDLAPRTCKDVRSDENRTVAKLADGLVVLCDTKTDGGGWLVFQRRVSADVDFYRNWEDYKYGFGNIRGNFWLGNENIHRLTSQRPHTMRVDLMYNNKSFYAEYSKFVILGEAKKYRLELGGFSGDAGNSLRHQTNMSFTTKDRHNDKSGVNCATLYHGAWWYNNCQTSHLNGLWGSKVYAEGLNWFNVTGHYASVTSSEMKIRPVECRSQKTA